MAVLVEVAGVAVERLLDVGEHSGCVEERHAELVVQSRAVLAHARVPEPNALARFTIPSKFCRFARMTVYRFL